MRTLLVFIVGLLLGANAVYFAMTRYARPDCARACPASDVPVRPIPQSPTTRTPPPAEAVPAAEAAAAPAYASVPAPPATEIVVVG